MATKVDTRRTVIFLAFAFGIAWLAGLVISLTGGLTKSLHLTPTITLAPLLISFVYSWAPALGHILTRLVTGEGWHGIWLRPNFRRGWKYWLIAWILPAILTILGAVVFYLLFPQNFDPHLTRIQQRLQSTGRPVPVSLWSFLALQVLVAILISPISTAIATFGEEFGWRAYLLPKLMPLGWKKAMLLMGLIWGVWHWPIIFMGGEYGFSYPGYPWLGPLLFIWTTFCTGTFLAWVTLRSGSVWPAVIGHSAIDGIAPVGALAEAGSTNPLLGPLPTGIIGSLGFAIVALSLFFSNPIRPKSG